VSRNERPTPAELRALRAYLDAGTARDAARRLGCSEQNVKNHLWSIRSKLGVQNTAQAVLILHDKLAA
jgi:DNA-binding CsgD family transcriptional regulator